MPNIPDRWIPYKACGEVIEGTRIICFKVPLKKNVQKQKREIKEIWDIPALLKKIPRLGAVIDLTNTSRYYNPNDLVAAGVQHKKILMPGRIIPPENLVKTFFNVADEFLGKDHDYLLGVHCTHGLNRTGYMVCRYMCDRLGIPVKDAIKRFEKARGYQIERENYIAKLLGKEPPPPDVGVETEIKAVEPRKNYVYKSPLQEDDDEEENHRRSYTSTRESERKRSRHKRCVSKERDRSNIKAGRSERRDSFDYRYDY